VTRRLALLIASVALGCAPTRLVAPLRQGPLPPAPDEPFRVQAPPLAAVVEAIDPPAHTLVLTNGLRVIFVPRHDVPLVAAELVIDRSSFDLGDAGGLDVLEMAHLFHTGGNDAARDLLTSRATTTGASWSMGESGDSLTATSEGPARSFEVVLQSVATMAVGARLARDTYDELASEWAQAARAQLLSVSLGERRVLFGRRQPYGAAGFGQQLVSLEGAQATRDRLFQPAQAILVVVGDVLREEVDERVPRIFAGWKGGDPLPRLSSQAPYENGPRVSIVSHRGLEQLQADVFARGPEASSQEEAAFELLVQVVGGGVSSKLFEELREAGDAYTPAAFVHEQRGATWMTIVAAYASERALDGVRRVLSRVGDLRAGRMTDEEIGAAREVLQARWRERLQSTAGSAHAYAEDAAYGLSRVREYPARIANVTRDDLVRVANAYLPPTALHVLFLGEDRWLDAESLGMGGATAVDLSK